MLGQGGSSRTWLAVDVARELELLTAPEPPEDLDDDGIPDAARVAVKELPLSRLREWKDLDRFEREAEMLGGLDHPGIPCSIDHFLIDEAEGPTFYLVQQWIDGQDLAVALDKGERWGEPRARELLAQLLPILHYLHTRRPALIHRDIKPSNIIVRRNGAVALIDFGAVRSGAEGSGSTVAGTFGYMAPEQLQGRASAASDVYALAATLCHLLCRRKPGDMPAREEAFGIDFRPWCEVSEGFARLLDDMLAPTEARRIASAAEVMARLDELDSRPSGAEALALRSSGAGLGLDRPRSGPRQLQGADYAYAWLGLPGAAGYLALLSVFLMPLIPIGPLLAFLGLFMVARRVREGYHNAEIMGRGTLVVGQVMSLSRAGRRVEVEYAYTFNRRAIRASVKVPMAVVAGLSEGQAIPVAIDPYAPEDSVPLFGKAGRRLAPPEGEGG